MKKVKIQEILTENGVQFDEKHSVNELKALAAENGVVLSSPSSSKMVNVVAMTPLFEAGASHAEGDEFELSDDRIDALGDRVKVIEE